MCGEPKLLRLGALNLHVHVGLIEGLLHPKIDRTRLLELWGFHYRIEVYTPAQKRRYGYYTLPILHRGRLVGRLDPKAHRAGGVLEIRRIHLEEGIEPQPNIVDGLVTALTAFARWQQLDRVEIGETNPPELASLLNAELAIRRSTTTGLEPSGTLLAP